ncbi:MAG: hypothetical protein B7Z25_01165 [Aerococcus viridans]|nr:MAG: hypothetical protein B7Z25_01165 [Aerococcus viridans]
MELTLNEYQVLSILPTGREQARSINQLANLVGMDKRRFNAIIHSLTDKGVPIVSSRQQDPRGIFIAETEAEKQQGLQPINHQIMEMAKRVETVQLINIETWRDDLELNA